MSNELAQVDNKTLIRNQPIGTGIVPRTLEEATSLANVLFKTGVFSADNAAQALAKVIIGADFGFSATFSLMNLYVFKGNIGMEYPAMAAVVKRAGYGYRVIEQSSARCTIQFLNRDGTEPGPPVTWTIEDSKKAGTQNMDKYPQAMLFARCFATGCRMYCADAFAGAIYSPEEIEEIRHSEPPAPIPDANPNRGIAALSEKIKAVETSEWVDPMADHSEPGQPSLGLEIPYLLTLGMTEDDQRDWGAYCESEGLDQKKIEADAKEVGGVKSKEDLFKYAEGRR